MGGVVLVQCLAALELRTLPIIVRFELQIATVASVFGGVEVDAVEIIRVLQAESVGLAVIVRFAFLAHI